MKKILLLLLFFSSFVLVAQNKINFQYDQAGNQISRILCINCQAKNAKEIKEIDDVTEEDLQKFSGSDLISYYPNPVKEQLYIQWEHSNSDQVSSITVYNINGQILKTLSPIQNSNNQNISFQEYASGVYVIALKYAGGDQKTIKIIKQ